MKRGTYSTQKRKRLATDETYLHLKKLKTECADTKENQKRVKVLLKQLRGDYGTKWVRKNVLPSLTSGTCKPFEQQVAQAQVEEKKATVPEVQKKKEVEVPIEKPRKRRPIRPDRPGKNAGEQGELMPPSRGVKRKLQEDNDETLPEGDTLAKKVMNATSSTAMTVLEKFLDTTTGILRNSLELYFLGMITARFGADVRRALASVHRIASGSATLSDVIEIINTLENRLRRARPTSGTTAAEAATEETEPLLAGENGVELTEIDLGAEGVGERALQPFLRARDFINSLSNRYEPVRAYVQTGRLNVQGVRDFLVQRGEQVGQQVVQRGEQIGQQMSERLIVQNVRRVNEAIDTLMSGSTSVMDNFRSFLSSPVAQATVDPNDVTAYGRDIDFEGMFGKEEWQSILDGMRDDEEEEVGAVRDEMGESGEGFVEPTEEETYDMFSQMFNRNAEYDRADGEFNQMMRQNFDIPANEAVPSGNDMQDAYMRQMTQNDEAFIRAGGIDNAVEETALDNFVTPNPTVQEASSVEAVRAGGTTSMEETVSAMDGQARGGGLEEVPEEDIPVLEGDTGVADMPEGATINFEDVPVETDVTFAPFEVESGESASLLGSSTEEGLVAANATRSMFAGGATSAARTFLSRGVGFLAQGLSKMLEIATAVQMGLQIAAGITNAAQLSEYRKNYPQQYIPLPPPQGGLFSFLNITLDKEKARGIPNNEWDVETDPDKSRNFTYLKSLDQNKRDAAFEWFLSHPDGQEKAFLGARTSIGDFNIDWVGDVQEERWYMGRQEAQYRFAKYNHAKTTYENVHGQGTYDNVIRFSDIMRHAGYGVPTSELVELYNSANTDPRLLIPDADNITEAEMMRLTDYKTHMMSKALLHYPDLDPANYRASKMDLTEADIALAKTTLKRVAKDEESERAHMDWFRIFQHEPDETPDEALKNNILRTKWEGIYPFGLEGGRYTTIDSAFDDWMPAHMSNLLGFGHDGQTLTYTYIDPSTGTKKTVSPQNGSWPPITLGDGRTMSVTMIKDDVKVGLVSINQEKPVYTIQYPPRTNSGDTKDTVDSKKQAEVYHDTMIKKHTLHEYNLHLSNEDYDNDKCRVMFIYASAATDNMHNFRGIVQRNHEVFSYVLNEQMGSCDMLVCKERDYLVIAFGEASTPNTHQDPDASLNHFMTKAFQGIREQALSRVVALYQQTHGLTQVYVTGIGTGGGVATLFAQEMTNTYQIIVQSVITFNTPAWFSTSYRQLLNNFNIYEVRAKKNTSILSRNHQQVTPSKVYLLDEAGIEKTVEGDLRVHLGAVNPYHTTRHYFWELLTSNQTDFDHMGRKYGAMNPMRRHWDLMLDNVVVKTVPTQKDVNLSNMYFTNSVGNTQQNVRPMYSKTSIDSKYLI
jgi:hypothetical protein